MAWSNIGNWQVGVLSISTKNCLAYLWDLDCPKRLLNQFFSLTQQGFVVAPIPSNGYDLVKAFAKLADTHELTIFQQRPNFNPRLALLAVSEMSLAAALGAWM